MDITLIIPTLAIWRLSSLFAREDGPFDILKNFRILAGVTFDVSGEDVGTNWFSNGLLCVWCNSVWFSGIYVVFITNNIADWFMHTLAFSTLVIAVESFINR